MERRKYERHVFSAPVKFSWDLPDSTRRHGAGVTRNFSAGGLFVITDDLPPVGTSLRFEVDVEISHEGAPVNIRAKGEVNRIETAPLASGRSGFAISAGRMRIQKPGSSPV